ncbi:hypothetical protein [Escherichia coli]|uniref:hypothetical protein n=1 Tax=Escherichia coli TaxID=562 RepID=UPI0034C66A11|nr:hypothetical protein [Escherichia coli]
MNAENSELNNLSFEFFQEFSRYEYCLKMTGLCNQDGNVVADWDKYASQVQIDFDSPGDPRLAASIDYYINNQPKRQNVKGGTLYWSDEPSEQGNKAVLVLMLIRRVRNNLFHGGKFNGHWFAPQRSKLLLQHGLIILKACAENHPLVQQAYNGIEQVDEN